MDSEEVQMMDKAAVQQKIDEMQQEIEQQRTLLDEKAREIEELKRLFDGSGEKAKQTLCTSRDCFKDSLEAVYEIVSGLEKYTTEEVLFYAAQILSELMDTRDVQSIPWPTGTMPDCALLHPQTQGGWAIL